MTVKLRTRKISGGLLSYYLDIYQDGNRYYEYLKLYTKPDSKINKQFNKDIKNFAETIYLKRAIAIIAANHNIIPSHIRNTDFVDYFKKITKTKNPSNSAWASTYKILEEYTKNYTHGVCKISNIDKRWIIKFRDHLLDCVSNNTARTYYGKIKAALNEAVRDEIIQSSPASIVKGIEKVPTLPTYLELNEVQKLANTECRRIEVKKAFIFACHTGLRVSDIKNLKCENVKEDHLDFVIKKTKIRLSIPLSETAKRILNERSEKEGVVKIFDLPDKTTIGRIVKEWSKSAGISKHITFHVSRHTFATLQIAAGVSVYVVQKLLGHKDITSTLIYAHVMDTTKQKAIDKLPAINLEFLDGKN